MSKGDIAIVIDCGATNVRTIAMNSRGEILAAESEPNNTRPDPGYQGGKIWDVEEIREKMYRTSGKVISSINSKSIAGVTVTTFGVDGTIFDGSGKMLYPVISWQCERTSQVMAEIDKYVPVKSLYSETGVLPFNFNTINKLVWLRENRPELVDKATHFLFIPSIFSMMLTGETVNDITMAGTSMVTSLAARKYSDNILSKIGFPIEKMGTPVEPGTIIGKVSSRAASETSIPEGTPVVATGHDTQFAIFGSGAGVNEPVLSSGTWEILMVRSKGFLTGQEQLQMGITTELDVTPGLYNIGNQWIASGMLEWARKTLYADLKENAWETIIAGAEKVGPGSRGVTINPKFYEELKGKPGGEIRGLTMDTTRDEIFRAMLESLAMRLKEGVNALEKAGGFRTDSILCVGGGSKNRLWNQLRADFTGVPVTTIDKTETTVLGASLFVQSACGNASSPEEARSMIDYRKVTYYPSSK
ncbi:MAG: L-fuculokinase [Bacteroidales bacterium]